MTATYLLLGEPDWLGMLIYAVIFFGSVGAFLLAVLFIYLKVFRGREEVTGISLGGEGGRADGRR